MRISPENEFGENNTITILNHRYHSLPHHHDPCWTPYYASSFAVSIVPRSWMWRPSFGHLQYRCLSDHSQLFHLIWILYSILKKNSTKVEARVVKGDLVGIFSLKRWMKAVLIFKRRTYGLLSSFSEDEAKTNEYRLWENKISF